MFRGICFSWALANKIQDKNSEKDFKFHLCETFSRFLVNKQTKQAEDLKKNSTYFTAAPLQAGYQLDQ